MTLTNNKSKVFAAIVGFSLTAASANAATILNPSFEADNVPDGATSFAGISNWILSNGAAAVADFDITTTSPATDGEQHIFVAQDGTVSQLTSFTVAAGETYTLTVDVGQPVGSSGAEGTIRLFGSTAGFGTALSNTNGTAELSGIAPTSGTTYLLNQTITYTALASGDPFEGQQLGIALVHSGSGQVLYDNVRLDIVPEPSSITLLGLGSLLIAGRRRR